VVTVGDEILLGEMDNANARWMLEALRRDGRPAAVALSLPDEPDAIARWIRALVEAGHQTIFVSGGIGGTHDDRTREGVARGLGLELRRHEECFDLLQRKYGERFNAQRQRMAMLPAGAALIDNPLGAPGFSVGPVHAFPGFPSMLQPMMLDVLARTRVDGEGEWASRQAVLACAEGEIAADVEAFARELSEGRLGIYPSSVRFGREVTLRLRCPRSDGRALARFDELVERLRRRAPRSS
jgi:molybdopterin-biosynthesis enzyme MoeA-like protein